MEGERDRGRKGREERKGGSMKMEELMSPPFCHNETFDAFICGALYCVAPYCLCLAHKSLSIILKSFEEKERGYHIKVSLLCLSLSSLPLSLLSLSFLFSLSLALYHLSFLPLSSLSLSLSLSLLSLSEDRQTRNKERETERLTKKVMGRRGESKSGTGAQAG